MRCQFCGVTSIWSLQLVFCRHKVIKSEPLPGFINIITFILFDSCCGVAPAATEWLRQTCPKIMEWEERERDREAKNGKFQSPRWPDEVYTKNSIKKSQCGAETGVPSCSSSYKEITRGEICVAMKGGLQIIIYNCWYKRGCYRATIWRVGICLFY